MVLLSEIWSNNTEWIKPDQTNVDDYFLEQYIERVKERARGTIQSEMKITLYKRSIYFVVSDTFTFNCQGL